LFNRPKCSSGRRASGFVLVAQYLPIFRCGPQKPDPDLHFVPSIT
jgi:hypothetical protein